MSSNISRRILIAVVGVTLLLSAQAFAVTSADYYQAGVQLYNQRNYAQAIQYFSAALSLDPNNAGALQGRANCNYTQGQYQQALDDYQKVQAINPTPQLSQFIQALQAKVGAAAPASPGLPGATTTGSFDQGVALYQQKQYAAAIPMFQQATRDNPNDSKAYYYLGVTQMMTGDMRDAALNLTLSDKKQPNPSIEAYVTQLRARLTPEDQQWVDGQVSASMTASGAAVSSGTSGKSKSLGFRLEPGISLLDLADFNTNAQTDTDAVSQLQSSYPDLSFSGSVPSGCVNIALEPVLRLSPNLELGVPLGYLAAGQANGKISNKSGEFISDSYDISAFEAGVNLRYLIGTGSIQPFVAAGALVAPININYSASANTTTVNYFANANPVTYSASGNFTGMAIGGQIQGGVDWHLGDTFTVSPFVGYQLATANSFQSTISGSGANGGQTAQLDVVSTTYGKVITPVSGGNLILPTNSSLAGSAVPPDSKPLTVDLSGLKAGVQVSVFF
ncbi:MAG TPA: tetratricopeptide repeat protein [bacterium]|nr:tetratricopeptide repeat protein [bacterium]